MEKTDLITMAEYFYQSAFDANCYYSITQQYCENYKNYFEELNVSPAFYSMIYNALITATIMELAKIFDKSKKAQGIGNLLKICRDEENIGFFKKARTPSGLFHHQVKKEEESFFRKELEFHKNIFDVTDFPLIPVDLTGEKYLDLYNKKFHQLHNEIERLRFQRNKIYAHSDEDTIMNMDERIQKNALKNMDVQSLINYALDFSRFIIAQLTGKYKSDKPVNITDWENTLMYVRRARQDKK